MQQAQIPCFPMSEKTRWDELPEIFEAAGAAYEQKMRQYPPLLIFEPYEESRIPGFRPTPSEAPEELIVVPIDPLVRKAVFEALERVEASEPKPPAGHVPKMPKFKENTPMKSFFRQMGDMPATVLSLTFPEDDSDSLTIFFPQDGLHH